LFVKTLSFGYRLRASTRNVPVPSLEALSAISRVQAVRALNERQNSRAVETGMIRMALTRTTPSTRMPSTNAQASIK